MSAINRFPSGGGGSKINGIIEEYKVAAGANVSAGDFVSFIQQLKGERELTSQAMIELASTVNVIGFSDAFEYEENKLVFVYESSTSYSLTAAIVTIDGTSITAVEHRLATGFSYAGSYGFADIAPMENNDFVLFHYYRTGSSSSSFDTKVYRLTITDDVPSVTEYSLYGSDGSTLSTYGNKDRYCPIFVAPDHLYFKFSYLSSGTYLTLYSAQIIDDSIYIKSYTRESGTSTSSSVGSNSQIALLDSTHIAYCSGIYDAGDTATYGVFTLSDDGYYVLSYNYATLSGTYYTERLFAVDSNHAFALQRNSGNNLYGAYITFNDDNSVSKTLTKLGTSYSVDVLQLDKDKFFAAGYSTESGSYLYFWLITLTSDGEVTAETWQPMEGVGYLGSASNLALGLLDDGSVFVGARGNAFSYAIWGGITNTIIEPTVAAYDTSRAICGVAKGSGAAGEAIEVTIPEATA